MVSTEGVHPMKKQNTVLMIATILLVIGGLNWGIIGLFDVDLINAIFHDTVIPRVVEVLIGLAAVYRLGMWVAQKTK